MLNKLTGLIPPMITPLDAEERIDRPAVAKVVEHLLGAGVHGLFLLGTAGEGATVREGQHAVLIEEAVRAARGRVPILAGCIATSTRRALDYIAIAAAKGADAVVITPPFYFGTEDQNVLYAHFSHIAQASPLPVVMYNIPQTTHSSLTAETIARLAELENIVAVKDSSGKMEHFQRIIALRPQGKTFSIFQGSESAMIDSLTMGADGLVAGSSNAVPGWIVALYQAVSAGEIDRALTYQQKVAAYRQACYTGHYWLSSLKTVVSLQGYCQPFAAEPIPPVTSAHREEIRQWLASAGLL
jgi:4-hydroxy-tetrahydrodipicolinate synthase